MSIYRIIALATRISKQFIRDRRTLVLLFVAPLVVMTILNVVLNNSTTGVTLGIVPPAGVGGTTLVTRLQQQAASQGSLTIIFIARDQVDQALKAGTADGVLIFPDDIFQQVQQNALPTISLRLEGASPTVAKQLQNIATLLVTALPSATAPSMASTAVAISIQPSYLYGGADYTATDGLAPLFIGLFSFFFVFLLTSVAFLRERTQGTIERILVAPMTRTELVMGYVVGFSIFALAQSIIILLYVIGILRVHYAGNPFTLFIVTALLTIGAVNMGIFVSAFARNELQIIQFIPLLIVPQVLLGGLFFPVNTLPVVLKQVAYLLPLTYANFALKDIMLRGFTLAQVSGNLVFLIGFAILMVVGAAFSLRQERV